VISDPDDDTSFSGPLRYTAEAAFGLNGAPLAISTSPTLQSWSFQVPIGTGGSFYVSGGSLFTMGGGLLFTNADNQSVRVRVDDPASGEFSIANVRLTNRMTSLFPIALDLDGDGLELLERSQGGSFDANADGIRDPIGWLGGDDAFLALDRNGDGAISDGSEISFAADLEGALSDLEGLTAFDSNGNRQLDALDQRFGEFLVWRDTNQDGVSQSDELQSLAAHAIASISLVRTLTGGRVTDHQANVLTATSQFRRTDGTVGTVGDVALSYQATAVEIEPVGFDQMPVSETDEPWDAGVGAEDRRADDSPVTSEASGSENLNASSDVNVPRIVQPADAEAGRLSTAEFDTRRGTDHLVAQPIEPATIESHEWLPQTQASARSALHANLDLIGRRRLQMIDAMAGFAPPDSAELSLQPHRSVDARTLELLTSIPQMKVA
jgi:hypothetical protein